MSDRDIREAVSTERISIDPFDAGDAQPSSVDLHVDRYLRTFDNHRHPYIDDKTEMEDLTELVEVKLSSTHKGDRDADSSQPTSKTDVPTPSPEVSLFDGFVRVAPAAS